MSIAVAVISDIHGNVWALESVLQDIRRRGIDCIVNLGDSLYGPIEPYSTAKILMCEKIISISGNQDRIILESIGETNIHQTMRYVLEDLDAQSVEWIKLDCQQ
ncbi:MULTISPECIES: metallophosphoesterase family protein [unclassified Dehalobacter]|uniref:metallophosphoesterase family protein n=1 Tax=unclassified Dehalobacter TaxID=2635733 RepID=UPI0006889AD5|nr:MULTISPECIES: metallophosphoesterase family protein [unclassified Dehalobacter]